MALSTFAACGDDADEDTPDGGAGRDAQVTVDGGMMDADASIPDGGGRTREVIVRFMAVGRPAPGTALFHDPNGALIAIKTTTTGEARAEVPEGSMASAFFAPEPRGKLPPVLSKLFSIAEVSPGETYTFEIFPISARKVGAVAVTLPGNVDDAFQYQVVAACNYAYPASGTAVPTFGVYDLCPSTRPEIGVLAVVRGFDGAGLAYSFATDLALTLSSTTPVTLPAWRQDFQDVDLLVRNIPADVQAGEFSRVNLLDGRPYFDQGRFVGLQVNEVSVPVRLPPFGDALQTTIDVEYTDGARSSHHAPAMGRGPRTLDLAALLLPPVRTASVTTTEDPARPRVSWTAAAGNPDAVILHVSHRSEPFVWEILLPPTRTSFRMPPVPAALTKGSTIALDPAELRIGFRTHEVSSEPDYASFRVHFGTDALGFGQKLNIATRTSTVRHSRFNIPEFD